MRKFKHSRGKGRGARGDVLNLHYFNGKGGGGKMEGRLSLFFLREVGERERSRGKYIYISPHYLLPSSSIQRKEKRKGGAGSVPSTFSTTSEKKGEGYHVSFPIEKKGGKNK